MIYMWFATRPIDLQIAASEAEAARIQLETAAIKRETTEKHQNQAN